MYGGAWLPFYAKHPQDLLTSTQKYYSAQNPGQCGEAMVMAACFALLVEANNGEHGGVNLIHIQCISFNSSSVHHKFAVVYKYTHPHPHRVTQKQQHYIVPTTLVPTNPL